MNARSKCGLILLGAALALSGCSAGESGTWKLAPETAPLQINQALPEGSALDDLNLAGLKPPEAEEQIKEWEQDKLEENLFLVYNETEIPTSLAELGISLDFAKTWQELMKKPGQRVASILKIDYLKANQVLQDKLKQFTRSAVDASYKIEKDQFVITPAQPGQIIQADGILQELQKKSLSSLPEHINVQMADIPASITTEALNLLAFDGIIGEYTTKFNPKEKNRTGNLIAAAVKLDKKVLKPGDTLSFNDTIGPRTVETGFKDAYIIINNEYVQGIGGGICQVSSTLYSAALMANLEIPERMPHAVAIAYIPLGQDATVNYPNIDFKVRNNTQSLIYIRTAVKADSLIVRIYGKKTNTSVRLEQEIEKQTPFSTVRKIDASLPPGSIVQDQRGSNGYVVKTWKVVKDAAGKETKQLLSRDQYAPSSRILRIGAD